MARAQKALVLLSPLLIVPPRCFSMMFGCQVLLWGRVVLHTWVQVVCPTVWTCLSCLLPYCQTQVKTRPPRPGHRGRAASFLLLNWRSRMTKQRKGPLRSRAFKLSAQSWYSFLFLASGGCPDTCTLGFVSCGFWCMHLEPLVSVFFCSGCPIEVRSWYETRTDAFNPEWH